MTSYHGAFICLDCRSYSELEIASANMIHVAQVFSCSVEYISSRIYFIKNIFHRSYNFLIFKNLEECVSKCDHLLA